MDDRRSPLYGTHDAAGASFTAFGGWEMPVSFDSIRVEHAAVRASVGRFDVSHMGELEVSGPDATALMQQLTTNDVTALDVGDAQYAAVTTDDGIMLEDTVIFRRPDPPGGECYLFVPNAGNNEAMADHWRAHRDAGDLEADVRDRTDELAMIAVQGPEAVAELDPICGDSIDDIGRFSAVNMSVADTSAWVSRTGYTGEDGFEVIVDADRAEAVWSALSCQRCGLGARDTLRLEAGLLLRGNEFHPTDQPRTPFEAGIGFAVDLETDFLGRDALAAQANDGPQDTLVGIGLTERGVPRAGYAITDPAGEPIGEITSGTMSPTLERPIALGYVPQSFAETGTDVHVEIRGESTKGKVESLPFVGGA